jgi:hypothetical protein
MVADILPLQMRAIVKVDCAPAVSSASSHALIAIAGFLKGQVQI